MSQTEQYGDTLAGATTLSADITTTGATTLSVTSASFFPSSPQFRIRVGTELMLVTGISGTTFTVTRGIEGTTAATHSTGDRISHSITSGSIIQASLARGFCPASPGFKPPVLTDFTWHNQGTATATQGSYGITLTEIAGFSQNLRLLYQSVPSTPYNITMFMQFHVMPVNGEARVGLFWWQSTGSPTFPWRCMWYRMQTSQPAFLAEQNWNLVTSLNDTTAAGSAYDDKYWLRISDSGTVQSFSVSRDGLNFVTLLSPTRNASFNRCGIAFSNNTTNTSQLIANVLSYSIT